MRIGYCFFYLLFIITTQHIYAAQHELATITKDFAIGSASGMAAMTVYTPFHYFQNRKIQGLPIAKTPSTWFRGWPSLTLGTVPTLATQIATYGMITRAIEHQTHQSLTNPEQIAAATIAGGTSGIIKNITHMVTLHQENTGRSLGYTTKQLNRSLTRGLGTSMVREMLFFNMYKVFLQDIHGKIKEKTQHETFSTVAGGIATGCAVTATTQPFMVVSAKLYADPAKEIYKHGFDAAQKIVNREGLAGFYKGALPRTPGVIGALLTLNYMQESLRG